MNQIETKNITKRYDDKLVVDNISLEVHKGDIFGLIGPNGAGKSTLINMITGLVKMDSGSASLGGFDIDKEAKQAKAKIGLVPQNLAVIKELSAKDNLEYFGAYFGLFGKVLKERVDEALKIIGLVDKQKEKVKKFSGGMMRRLNLGCAIMHHPEILILDEPTVGVDAQSRNYIFDYIRSINQEFGTTILYTSHYMEEVETLCNRLLIMDNGKVVSYGGKEEIKRLNGGNNTIHLITEGIEPLQEDILKLPGVKGIDMTKGIYHILMIPSEFDMEKLIELVHGKKHTLKSLSVEEPSLEEIFLALTGKTLRD